MRRTSVSRWVVGVLATMMLAACGTETGGEVGNVNVSLTVDGVEVNRIKYSISGGALGSPLQGNLPVKDDKVAEVIANLPVGVGYKMTLTALQGNVVVCSGTSLPFDIQENQTTPVDIVLVCDESPDPDGTRYGDAQVNGTFDVQTPPPLNGCPVVHSYTAIPSSISEGGDSAAEVVASDPNGQPLTYSWSASEGSFDDSSSSAPTYTCTVPGTQTLTVVVSDGDTTCDATTDITVGCGGEVICSTVDCGDTGNECTAVACVEAQGGACVESNLDGASCASGTGVCEGGSCVIDLCPASCDDGNECTTDSCDPAVGTCEHADLDNAQSCNGGTGICQAGACESVGASCAQISCDDGDPCTLDVCIEGSTPTESASCAPPQDALDGTSCGANATCQAGVCTGAAPDPQPVVGNVQCVLPLGLGTADVDVNLTVEPTAAWTPNGAVNVGFSASAVIPAALGQLLVGLGTDLINIDSLSADLGVVGGTPSPIVVTKGAESFDVDANDDGTAEDLLLVLPVDPAVVTNDGSASVDFAITHFEVSLSGVPLLGNIVVSEDPTVSTIECTLSSSTASFPAN